MKPILVDRLLYTDMPFKGGAGYRSVARPSASRVGSEVIGQMEALFAALKQCADTKFRPGGVCLIDRYAVLFFTQVALGGPRPIFTGVANIVQRTDLETEDAEPLLGNISLETTESLKLLIAAVQNAEGPSTEVEPIAVELKRRPFAQADIDWIIRQEALVADMLAGKRSQLIVPSSDDSATLVRWWVALTPKKQRAGLTCVWDVPLSGPLVDLLAARPGGLVFQFAIQPEQAGSKAADVPKRGSYLEDSYRSRRDGGPHSSSARLSRGSLTLDRIEAALMRLDQVSPATGGSPLEQLSLLVDVAPWEGINQQKLSGMQLAKWERYGESWPQDLENCAKESAVSSFKALIEIGRFVWQLPRSLRELAFCRALEAALEATVGLELARTDLDSFLREIPPATGLLGIALKQIALRQPDAWHSATSRKLLDWPDALERNESLERVIRSTSGRALAFPGMTDLLGLGLGSAKDPLAIFIYQYAKAQSSAPVWKLVLRIVAVVEQLQPEDLAADEVSNALSPAMLAVCQPWAARSADPAKYGAVLQRKRGKLAELGLQLDRFSKDRDCC